MTPLRDKFYGFLRWSEKYTKTDMVYLAHGGFWLSLGTIVTGISSFALSIAFANLISPTAYGIYKYVLSLAGTFNAFTLTGLSTAVTVAVSNGKEGILKRAFWTNLWWSIPTATVAVVGSIYYFVQGNPTLGVSLLLIALIQPLTVSVSFGDAYLTGKKAFKLNSINYIVDNVVPAILLVGVMLVSQSAMVVLITYFLANLATTAGMYWYVLRRFKPNDAQDESALGYGKHLSAMSVFSIAIDNLDKLLTFHFLGPAALAIYSFALALPMQSKLITKPLSNLLFPKFAARSSSEIRDGMGEKTLRFFILGLVMTVGYILIAPLAFKLFYPQYMEAVRLSQIFAISLLGITFTPMGSFISAKRKVKAQYIMSLCVSIFQLLSVIVGIVYAGIMGLIIARVATRLFGGAFAAACYYLDKSGEEIA